MVRTILSIIAKNGINPNNHMLCVSFLTSYPGVMIPEYLREQYPTELEIVLQHEFANLEVSKEEFAVTLGFGEQDHHIVVPFRAVTAFKDLLADFDIRLEALPSQESFSNNNDDFDDSDDEGITEEHLVINTNMLGEIPTPDDDHMEISEAEETTETVINIDDDKIIDFRKFRKK